MRLMCFLHSDKDCVHWMRRVKCKKYQYLFQPNSKNVRCAVCNRDKTECDHFLIFWTNSSENSLKTILLMFYFITFFWFVIKNTCLEHSTGKQNHWVTGDGIVIRYERLSPSKARVRRRLPLHDTHNHIKEIQWLLLARGHTIKPLSVNTFRLESVVHSVPTALESWLSKLKFNLMLISHTAKYLKGFCLFSWQKWPEMDLLCCDRNEAEQAGFLWENLHTIPF